MIVESEIDRSESAKFNKQAIAALSVGHFVNDAYSSAIYPLLPLLATQLHLSELRVFFLMPVLSITASFMQPVYGFIADRRSRRMFAVIGPALIGCFVSLIGVAPNYWVLLGVLFCAGVGAGAFHPQAVSLAAQYGGDRRRVGVSIFSSSGTLGFAFGPLIIALIVGATGLSKTTYTIGVGVVASALLYFYCPARENKGAVDHHLVAGLGALVRTLKKIRGPLSILAAISLSRATMYLLMGNFMPFILKGEGYRMEAIGGTLTASMLAGALGSFAGGAIAEWVGGRGLSVVSGVLATLFLVPAFLTQGMPSIVLMIAGTFVLMSIIPVNITQAQELAPRETSTVSALLMGVVWGLGSLVAPATGPLAGKIGFRLVLAGVAVLPMLTGLVALALPNEREAGMESIREISLAASTGGD
jgi:FSR family fosmidomycin resistance protein-like MFS transporter